MLNKKSLIWFECYVEEIFVSWSFLEQSFINLYEGLCSCYVAYEHYF